MINSYKDLKVWQYGIDITEEIYTSTQTFPKSEIYGLCSQMQRAAVSIPSNIAEGHARNSTKEFLRFLSIALGSIAELETQIILAERLNYLKPEKSILMQKKLNELGKMIRGLQKSLKAKL